jgi:hypothetical protein
MFGIAWGVGSLLLLAGVGEGFRNGNRKQLESFGKNIIFFFGGRAPRFRTKRWNEIPENPAPERRTNLAQRFSAGKSGPNDSSPGRRLSSHAHTLGAGSSKLRPSSAID